MTRPMLRPRLLVQQPLNEIELTVTHHAEDVARALDNGQPSNAAPTYSFMRSSRVPRCIYHPEQRFANGSDTGKAQDAPFEPAHAVGSEVPTVDQRGHPHRYDEPG